MSLIKIAYAMSAQPKYPWDPVDHKTNQRAWMYSLALMIPIALAFLSGAAIALAWDAPLLAIPAGIFMAAVIGIFDWLLLNNADKKNAFLVTARCVVSVLIAILCTVCIDMYIFKDDIMEGLKVNIVENNSQFKKEEAELVTRLATLEKRRSALEDQYLNEIAGRGVKKGYGPEAKRLKADTEQIKVEIKETKADLDKVRDSISSVKSGDNQQLRKEWESMGFVKRLNSFHSFLSANPITQWLWAMLFFVIVFLDLTVVLCKVTHQRTVDDEVAKDLMRKFSSPDKEGRVS